MALVILNPRILRNLVPGILGLLFLTTLFYSFSDTEQAESLLGAIPTLPDLSPDSWRTPTTTKVLPKHKPAPTFAPAPIADPFPLLATSASSPPSIPEHNLPPRNLHKEYGLERPVPLYIGFTRQWPMLLQAVVSLITAG